MAYGIVDSCRRRQAGMRPPFGLFLFSTNTAFIRQAVAAGVDGVVIDWERMGKFERQASADTQIGTDTYNDLVRVRSSTDARVICRVNGFGPSTRRELERAIAAGADEVLLPMVRSVSQVEQMLEFVGGRCGAGILVETVAALGALEALTALPLARIYVGLNDLAIERRTPNIFTAVADGTVETIRKAVRSPFGFGGLTLPDRGSPIPCRLLMGEMARLECDFSFLRRSFLRDIEGRDLAQEIPRLRQALQEAAVRPADAVKADRDALEETIRASSSAYEPAQSLE